MTAEQNLANATTWVLSQQGDVAHDGTRWTLLVDEAVERFGVDIEDLDANLCAKLNLRVPPPSALRPKVTFQQGLLTIRAVATVRMPTLTFEDREAPEGAVIEGHYVCEANGVIYPYGSSPEGYWAADGLGWGIWQSAAERDLAVRYLAARGIGLPSAES